MGNSVAVVGRSVVKGEPVVANSGVLEAPADGDCVVCPPA